MPCPQSMSTLLISSETKIVVNGCLLIAARFSDDANFELAIPFFLPGVADSTTSSRDWERHN